MLAQLERTLPRGDEWRYEPKLDGFRGLPLVLRRRQSVWRGKYVRSVRGYLASLAGSSMRVSFRGFATA
jgi:hypothetical protein